MPSQNIEKIAIGGKTYRFDSLSEDAQGSIRVISELNGKINEFKKDAHFLELSRNYYEQQLASQMPSSSLEDDVNASIKELEDKNAKQDKDSGVPTTNRTKSGWIPPGN